MAIHVLMLPRIVTKTEVGVTLAPNLGSFASARWGQASSKLGDESNVVVWIDLPDSDADALVAEVGGKSLGVALPESEAARVLTALATEKPARFDEARQKSLALSKRVGTFLASDLDDATALAEYRAIKADRVAAQEAQADVAAFDRVALKELQAGIASIVVPLEAAL